MNEKRQEIAHSLIEMVIKQHIRRIELNSIQHRVDLCLYHMLGHLVSVDRLIHNIIPKDKPLVVSR